ncbi:hypothetical protein NHG29_01325 [Aerococcaceae bacterium NML160702]|nr:hypothetical protein [Aerococcaceae bacterium NML190073]MCW6681507.1 hypothetical protein [Aerococcaceae bacterium NML160702]
MFKKIIIALLLFFTLSTTTAHAYELSIEQKKAISDSELFFKMLDDGVKDVKVLDGMLLESAWNTFNTDFQLAVIARKKDIEELKVIVPTMADTVDSLIAEIDDLYQKFNDDYNDYLKSAAAMQNKAMDYDMEWLANRVIAMKYYYASIHGKGPIEIDAIYQKIRVDY